MTDETELRDLERRLAKKHVMFWSQMQYFHGDGWFECELECDELRYLDLRGLLERKPDAPHLVRVKDGEL